MQLQPTDTILNFIDGEFHQPATGNRADNVNPATGKVYSTFPDSTAPDVAHAVAAAQQALPAWANTSIEERSAILHRLADLIDANHETLAQAETQDSGKPITTSRTIDIPRAAKNIRFFAQAITQFSSESHAMPGAINYTLRAPIGVVGCISPWNLPLYLFTWKIAPALATGNCVIAKPSEVTPMTAFMLSQLANEAGIPKGVLNILHGFGGNVGAAIVEHPAISAISFTGGTSTGQAIARTAAPMFKKLSLELGGKNPNIIFADCDYQRALNTSIMSSFNNQGQICLCGSRIYVERPIFDQFRDDFVRRASTLVNADPLEQSTRQGAVVSKQHMEKVLSHIDIARQEGGTILCGGERALLEGRCSDGYFIQPTVIAGLDDNSRTNQEEIFGPVVTIQPFDTEEEVIASANSTQYGLAATIWTENVHKAHRMAEAVKSGIIWVNCWMVRDLRTPFGGMKQSGVGREGGHEALRFFTEPKNVCISYSTK
jgi:aminomuconate-semialdehyde/2-hydroxymuconate-6-semialdehyde dehydrogenase